MTSQFTGQEGISIVWLWIAITMAGASHTEHLKIYKEGIFTIHRSPLSDLTVLILQCLPADVRLDALSSHSLHRHRHGSRSGQPVGVVVTGSKVADVVYVAEHERHGAESAQTAAGRACSTNIK